MTSLPTEWYDIDGFCGFWKSLWQRRTNDCYINEFLQCQEIIHVILDLFVFNATILYMCVGVFMYAMLLIDKDLYTWHNDLQVPCSGILHGLFSSLGLCLGAEVSSFYDASRKCSFTTSSYECHFIHLTRLENNVHEMYDGVAALETITASHSWSDYTS